MLYSKATLILGDCYYKTKVFYQLRIKILCTAFIVLVHTITQNNFPMQASVFLNIYVTFVLNVVICINNVVVLFVVNVYVIFPIEIHATLLKFR